MSTDQRSLIHTQDYEKENNLLGNDENVSVQLCSLYERGRWKGKLKWADAKCETCAKLRSQIYSVGPSLGSVGF